MAGLTSSGIGSGLDVAGLVAKLIDAERTPTLARLAGKEAVLQAQLSGFGQLRGGLDQVKSALDGLNSSTLLTAHKAVSGDDTRFTASAEPSAAPGTYAVEVSSLAKAQKLASGAFTGADAVVGTGTLTLALDGKTASITVDDSNKTLAGIRDAINAARDADGKPLGVTATLVTSTGATEPAGTYLVLTSSKTGAANTIGLTQTGGDGGLAAIQYETGGLANGLTETEPPGDAVVKVDNGLHKVVREQGGYNAATRKGGVLIGEPALRNLESQLRRHLVNPLPGVSGTFTSGADIGLSLDATGKLTLDGVKFDAALAGDRTALADLLQGDDALVGRLTGVVDGYLATTGGMIKARTDGIDRRLRDIDEQRQTLDLRLASLEKRYLNQFNALDGLLAQLSSTGSFLAQQLDALPGATSSDK